MIGEEAKTEAEALPLNIEAEQALLGALMYDNEAFYLIEALEPAHFYEPAHQRLFGAISRRITGGQLAEPITLDGEFSGDPAFIELGGLQYLADLVDRAPPSRNIPDYAAQIIDRSIRRELLRLAGETKSRAVDYAATAREQLEAIEGALFGLAETKRDAQGFHEFSTALDGAMALAEAAASTGDGVSGISTGLADLDSRLGGLHGSALIILAGRPGSGKTALATSIAFNIAKTFEAKALPDGSIVPARGGRVGFFSLEMSKEELAMRIISDVSKVAGEKIRKGEIDIHQLSRMRDASKLLRSMPLHIDETGGIRIDKLCSKARRLKRTKGLDVLFVDYLQLSTGTERSRGQGRVQEISEITAALKSLAKELNIPVIALSQLSRKVEERDDKKPKLSDLRESGSIEQDADAVCFIFREAYYLEQSEPKEGTTEHFAWSEKMDQARGVAEVIIAKQRHGPTGTVRLHFDGETTRFTNLANSQTHHQSDSLDYGS